MSQLLHLQKIPKLLPDDICFLIYSKWKFPLVVINVFSFANYVDLNTILIKSSTLFVI